jgi:hypothetical protein
MLLLLKAFFQKDFTSVEREKAYSEADVATADCYKDIVQIDLALQSGSILLSFEINLIGKEDEIYAFCP